MDSIDDQLLRGERRRTGGSCCFLGAYAPSSEGPHSLADSGLLGVPLVGSDNVGERLNGSCQFGWNVRDGVVLEYREGVAVDHNPDEKEKEKGKLPGVIIFRLLLS